ncbi:hypothetical protein LCGC14_0622660 [marine sediment metagenome]|uniref:Uncharacterized protein n=1 Tax=marine sediment metagenome TaxID=412755 RepID=A0A0F9R4F0_9ZZZZ
MILKLDKRDTQEIFKEFVDEATREHINSKIKSLFDQRVDKLVEDKLGKLDLDKMLKGQLDRRLDKHFKGNYGGEMEYANKRIDKRLEEFDFKTVIGGSFVEDVASAVWRRMRQASKTAEAL